MWSTLSALFVLALCSVATGHADTPAPGSRLPDSYIDPVTGHQVVRLLRTDYAGSTAFYFHQNEFTVKGDKMVLIEADSKTGANLYSLDLLSDAEMGTGPTARIANPKKLLGMPVVDRSGRNVYYATKDGLFATDIDTKQTRAICTWPLDWDLASQSLQLVSVNSDATLLAGADNLGAGAIFESVTSTKRQDKIDATYEAHLPGFLFTVNIKTGKISIIHRENTWLDHTQFSPTDPNLIMFAHEGPWNKVDRIWLIHADGTGLTNFRPHKSPGDACGHEFWDPSGKMVWFDYSAGDTHSLVGQDIRTGKEISYTVLPKQYSRHYNISHSGKLFAGDGNPGPREVPMIILLVPQPDGTLRTEPLCDISQNDYNKREPNVMFSPDDKWVIFTSDAGGRNDAYAVRIDK